MELGEVRKYSYEMMFPKPGGSEFRRIEHLIRIIGIDEIEVYYEVWLDHKNSWNLKGLMNAAYYRIAIEVLDKNSEYVRSEVLTNRERKLHRPDLAHRCCRTKFWNWSTETYSSLDIFTQSLNKTELNIDEFNSQKQIETARIVLLPSGPKGGTKPPVIVSASNGEYFSNIELLWYAHNIQAKWKTPKSDGVGLYRSGLSKGLPMYYLGEQYDAANLLKP
jgi:hypothetical protein